MKKYRLVCGPHTGLSHSPFYTIWAAAINDPDFEVIQQLDIQEKDLQDVDVLVLFEPRFLSIPTNAQLKVGIFCDLHRSDQKSFENLCQRIDWCDIPFAPYKFSRLNVPQVKFLSEQQLDRFVVLPHSLPPLDHWRFLPHARPWVLRDIDIFILKPLDMTAYPFVADVIKSGFMDGLIYIYSHPGYNYNPQSRDARYEWYSRIQRAKISIAGMGFCQTGYPVAKYNDYRAMATVLIAERPPEIYRRLHGLEHGKDCFLVERGDFKEMRKIIDWLYRNPDQAMSLGERGREKAVCHSADRQLQYIKAVCESFMQTGTIPSGDQQVELYRQITGLDACDARLYS